jgi:hypothetical protein
MFGTTGSIVVSGKGANLSPSSSEPVGSPRALLPYLAIVVGCPCKAFGYSSDVAYDSLSRV